jgi:Ca-activated chloride channel homolog
MKIAILKFLVIFCSTQLLSANFIFAQSSKKLIHDGNKKYEEKKYNEAEIDYRKAVGTNENPFVGNYNLGNTYYQQGKYDEAAQQYLNAAGTKSVNQDELAKTFHNLGNTFVKNKKFEEGVQAYKQALKLNPKDNDTRYNLAYAQAMLNQQQQQQQNNDKNQDKNQDKDKKDQQNKQDQKDKQDKEQQQKEQEQKQEQAKEDQQKKEQQPKKDKISKEDAEKILQALNNDEKKTQKKLNVKQPVKIQIEKEW